MISSPHPMTDPTTASAPKCERCHDRLEPCRSLDDEGNVCEWKCCECDVDFLDDLVGGEEVEMLILEYKGMDLFCEKTGTPYATEKGVSNRHMEHVYLGPLFEALRTLQAKLEAQAKLLEKCRSAFGIEGANPEYHRQCREWLRDKWKPLYEALSTLFPPAK